jgi:hypothetical protein
LIRDGLITKEMATFLINYSGYVQNISRRLIEAGETVLEDRAYDLLMAVRAINLDADDESVSGSEARVAS